ncbi:MAG TPA: M55 family metallopeptidase [Gemmatimonadales bacterium]|nr:M55 family metallopeptidase [Gemmatimonadales bacterium]
MRIYISVDMEGIAGVVHEDQTNPIDPRCAGEYGRFRALMTAEANAAIEGAIVGGAAAVLVNDSHWLMRNLLAEQLHPSAQLVSGGPKTWSMMEGIESGHDAAVFIGYHARAGTQNAILDHTYTDRILDVRVNGTSMGELGLNATLAGSYGVPLVLVSGDQALAAEAGELLGQSVKTVIVKTALSRNAARSLSPSEACGRIRQAAEQAVRSLGSVRPFLPKAPYVLEVDFRVTVEADLAQMAPGVTRTGPRTVAYQHQDFREVFRALRTMFNLASDSA